MPEKPQTTAQTIVVLGTPISIIDMKGTLKRIEEMIESGSPHFIITPNVDFVVQAGEDQELHRILCDADLVICDGMPLVWASKWFGNPIPERVAGSDLAVPLLELAERKRLKLFLLGAETAVNRKAAETIRNDYPNINLVGNYSPPYASLVDMDHEDINKRITEAKPDILLVGFGCPKQEKWINMNYQHIGVPVSIGVGATVDFIAGKVSRAPQWMRNSGLEWFYRLIKEPRRMWKRYVKDIVVFTFAMIKYRRYIKWRGNRSDSSVTNTEEINSQSISEKGTSLELPERLDAANAAIWSPIMTDFIQKSQIPRFDLSKIKFIDSTGLGELIRVRKESKDGGKEYYFHECSKEVTKLLKITKLENQFNLDPSPAPLIKDSLEEERSWGTSYLFCPERDCKCIRWIGNWDQSNANYLLDTTERFINTSPRSFKILEIDLAKVDQITSATVVIMKKLEERAKNSGWDLKFNGASEQVINVVKHAKALHLLNN